MPIPRQNSGQRRVKETITTVLKAVVLGDESIVGAATTDDDLKELGAVAGAVIHAIKKAEVPADWGWEGRYYEIVKIYDENWEDLLRLLCEFTPDIDVQAVANITDVDNSDEGSGLGVNLEGVLEYPKAVKNVSFSGLGYDGLLEATETSGMVVCYNHREESHWEEYNFDKSKSNHEEYHYYKHEMVFVSPRNDQETSEMAATTLPGVPREPWNEFHTRKEQERVCKKARKPLGSS
ncbi:hypothetical protein ACHAO1_002123 [Botrytis cinerea]